MRFRAILAMTILVVGCRTELPREPGLKETPPPTPIDKSKRAAFCDDLHVRYQAGKLSTSPEEMARYKQYCQPYYQTDLGYTPKPKS
jgi:hypothetical protein